MSAGNDQADPWTVHLYRYGGEPVDPRGPVRTRVTYVPGNARPLTYAEVDGIAHIHANIVANVIAAGEPGTFTFDFALGYAGPDAPDNPSSAFDAEADDPAYPDLGPLTEAESIALAIADGIAAADADSDTGAYSDAAADTIPEP